MANVRSSRNDEVKYIMQRFHRGERGRGQNNSDERDLLWSPLNL